MVHKSHLSASSSKNRTVRPSYKDRQLTKDLSTQYQVGNYITWEENSLADSNSALYRAVGNADSCTLTFSTENATTGYTYATWRDTWSDNSTATTGDWDYWPATGSPTVIREIIKEKVVTKEVTQRSLFRVYVVDPRKNGKILFVSDPIIAENENQAMLKAGVATVAVQAGLELEQVDVHVEHIGTFIRPRKETQRVKISKEED